MITEWIPGGFKCMTWQNATQAKAWFAVVRCDLWITRRVIGLIHRSDFASHPPLDARQTRAMQIRLSVRDADGYSRDVALSGPVGTSLGEVADAIAAMLPRAARGIPELWHGSRRLPSTALLGGPGLRTGDLIDVDGPGERDLATGAVLRIHVVGGPDAGLIAPLPRGVVTIGRAPGCDLTLTDPDVSRQHCAITVTSSGISFRDLGSTNGTYLDRYKVTGPTPVPLGVPIRIGRTSLELRP